MEILEATHISVSFSRILHLDVTNYDMQKHVL